MSDDLKMQPTYVIFDQILVQKAHKGDTNAFGFLYDRHASRVFHLLSRLTASRGAAEGLAQETFIAAHASLGEWSGKSGFSSWLCGIAIKKYATAERFGLRQPKGEPLDDAEEADVFLPNDDPFAQWKHRDADAALSEAIASLPDTCRDVFILMSLEGMSCQSVADILDVPLEIVQSRLNRAARSLHSHLSRSIRAGDSKGRLRPTPTVTTFDRSLRTASQRLVRKSDSEPIPRELRARILSRLPEQAADSGAADAAAAVPLPVAVVGVALAVAAVGIGFGAQYVASHRRPPAVAPKPAVPSPPVVDNSATAKLAIAESSKILAAVDRENSWHLSESFWSAKSAAHPEYTSHRQIWERRSPFFYRDDVDGETIIDDGQSVIHTVPPWPIGLGKGTEKLVAPLPGRIIIRPSHKQVSFTSIGLPGHLLGSAGRANNPSPGQEFRFRTGAATIFGAEGGPILTYSTEGHKEGAGQKVTIGQWTDFEETAGYPFSRLVERLSANSVTHLPDRYRDDWSYRSALSARNDVDLSRQFRSEEIAAEYNCALPHGVTHLEPPPGYVVVDLRKVESLYQPSPPPGTSGSDGVQFRAESVTQDTSGNYYVRLRVLFGGRPELQQGIGVHIASFAMDEATGNAYVCTTFPDVGYDPSLTHLVIAPLETESGKANPPELIRLRLSAILSDEGNYSRFRLVGSDISVPLHFALPVANGARESKYKESFVIRAPMEPATTVLEQIAVARADYYSRRKPAGKKSATGNLLGRAANSGVLNAPRSAYWWNVASNEAEQIGEKGAAQQYRARSELITPH